MPEYEPPTEPLAAALPSAVAAPPPPPAPIAAPARSPFSGTHYRFTTGLRAGEVAAIRGEEGQVLLSYRTFASVTGVIAALVSGIVALAGFAAVLFLLAEGAPFRAVMALLLTLAFSSVIALLVPRVNVTLYDEHHPALTISQRTIFPAATYLVATPNGATIAELRKSPFSRLGRNRWTIAQDGRFLGDAKEESFFGALTRKFLGKFKRRFETNLEITYGGVVAGRIIRRPDGSSPIDTLELTSDALDRRVAVALATLVLGREP
ncbi:MAG: hypothetical protein QOJ98_2173 [Acidobacteriota bacterium]|nr:hypothetical protein [Acidobacteriota bacterium]